MNCSSSHCRKAIYKLPWQHSAITGTLTGLETVLLGEVTVGLTAGLLAVGEVDRAEGLVMGGLVTRGLVDGGLITDEGLDTAGGLAGRLGNISR